MTDKQLSDFEAACTMFIGFGLGAAAMAVHFHSTGNALFGMAVFVIALGLMIYVGGGHGHE
jgi:hypothetical protein